VRVTAWLPFPITENLSMESIAVYQSYYAFLALALRPLMIAAILLGLWIAAAAQ
jgi:hypothetical protein